MLNKKILTLSLLVILLVTIISWFFLSKEKPEPVVEEVVVTEEEEVVVPVVEIPKVKVIGTSVEGRPIETHTYGNGSTTLLFVGGVHGGYEWNSTLLAYDFIDNLESGAMMVPENLRVVIIPTLNPDGLFSVVQKVGRFTVSEIPPNDAHTTGAGRFNANNVDLNRNFACKWAPESSWRGKTVGAGTAAFSEPEAAALRDLVAEINPSSVVFWHSQANTVYASECENGILPKTLEVMNTYAKAASYKTVAKFDAYPITGDAEGWLASIGIPAVTVELESRTSSEWPRNKAGIEALFALYTTR
jgi:predicted deacylase